MWWIGSGVNANFTGCVVDLATWMDSYCKSWKLWHQQVNKITRSFMKAGLLEQQENMWLAKIFQDQAGTDNGFILDIHVPPKQQLSGPSLQQVRPADSGHVLGLQVPSGLAQQQADGSSARQHRMPAKRGRTYSLSTLWEESIEVNSLRNMLTNGGNLLK